MTPKRVSRWGSRPEEDPAARLTQRATPELSLATQIKANPPAIPFTQFRHFKAAAVAVQRRGGVQSARMVRGLALPYGEIIDLESGQSEQFRYGCFKDSLTSDDPRVLFNGNIERVLGRTSAGTARFDERRDGLHFEADFPDCSWAADLATSMDRGDIDGTSCAFIIERCEPQKINGRTVNVITKAKLIAACVSTFSMLQGANESTSELIASARISGFEMGLAEGKRAAKVEQAKLRNRLAKAQASAMGVVTPTDRTAREFQQRIGALSAKR